MFSKLYDRIVWSTIRGTKEYLCINAVQNRACRFFLGVGKYAPNNAVNGDMGWIPPLAKQLTCVVRTYFRLIPNMPDERIKVKEKQFT